MGLGYRVEYASVTKVRGAEKRRSGAAALTGLCFCGFLLLVCYFWPEGRRLLQELVIPGDPEVTLEALEVLAVELKAGAGLSDALTVFCRQVMQGAVSG